MPWQTDENGLTIRQHLFVNYLIADGFKSRSQAAIKAGFSEKCARQVAYEILTKPYVKQYMRERMQELAEKVGLTPELTLGALKNNIEQLNEHAIVKIDCVDGNGFPSKRTVINTDALNSMHKLIGEAHKVLDLYPKEDKQEETNPLENKDEILDKCRKDC